MDDTHTDLIMRVRSSVERHYAEDLQQEGARRRLDAVFDALAGVDRAHFIPESYRCYAYTDQPLPLGFPQATCSSPFTVARMAFVLELFDGANVLEIGTGCGYSAAITERLIGQRGRLTTLEIQEGLVDIARQNLARYVDGLDRHVHLIHADGGQGYYPHACYDRIYFTTAVPGSFNVESILPQLGRGGILVFPNTREEMIILRKDPMPYLFVPLLGAQGGGAS